MSYYHGLISSRRANSLLNQRPDGSFLIRDSQSQPGNFVLSAKYTGRMYHVLVFQQGGKYVLDSAGEQGEEPVPFNSLDELVLFLTGHNLRVEDEEVQLTEVCLCADDSARLSSNSVSRVKESDDMDSMTDIFANLFGTRSVIICVAHSSIAIDGSQGPEEKLYWAVLVKDLNQKGYFIRIVDKKEKTVKREKKVGKQFQYDMPSDLIMTFLSEYGITCVGFRDTQEKDKFLHQIDRVVKLQQERSLKLRGRASSEKQKPTEITHRIKASEFDVDNLSSEWQYLFDQAGVSQDMLRDKSSLQFILDTVYEIGGAPQNISSLLSTQLGSEDDNAALEREHAIKLDANLKKESIRASMLSNILQKQSLKKPMPVERDRICSYLATCERFKDHLVIKYSMIALGPENAACFCDKCADGKPLIQTAGSPPQQFSLPVGWAQFIHNSQKHSLAQHFCKRWHVAYCCVPASQVPGIMRTGQLVHYNSSSVVKLSPDIQCACAISPFPPDGFHDNTSGHYYQAHTVFQVFIQPGTYTVHVKDTSNMEEQGKEGGSSLQSQLEWWAVERTYIVHSLWISMVTVS